MKHGTYYRFGMKHKYQHEKCIALSAAVLVIPISLSPGYLEGRIWHYNMIPELKPYALVGTFIDMINTDLQLLFYGLNTSAIEAMLKLVTGNLQ